MEKFNWCFIGTGKLAKTVSKQIIKTGRHDVVSCFTRKFSNGEAFAKKLPNCKAYENVEDAINDPRVDGVYVVTSHNAHYKYAKISLLNNKPTFVEKPFTVFKKDAEDLISLAKEKNLFLAEAMWTWFSDTGYKIKDVIESGQIGDILAGKMSFNVVIYNPNTRISDPKRAGGALLDLGVYPVTYAYKLFGMPKNISGNAQFKDGCDLKNSIFFDYGKFQINITSSIVDFDDSEYIKIKGTNGKISCFMFHRSNCFKLTIGRKSKYVKDKGPLRFDYTQEFDITADDIRSGRKESSRVGFQHTLDVMELLDKIREVIGLKYEKLE